MVLLLRLWRSILKSIVYMFELNCEKKAIEIQEWIKKTVYSAGLEEVIVAVSGGIDSAVSLSLAIRSLGKEHVYALLLPYADMSPVALEHGKLASRNVGLAADHILVRDIQPGVDKLLSQIQNNKVNDVRKGNVMARVRMIYLFDLAKSLSALVVGTENKTEHYLGYFTRFGDEASDVEPIRSLYKTQVFAMGKELGVSDEIIKKTPSANLWEGQSDEGEFGFSYDIADRVLFLHFEEKKSEREIIASGIGERNVRDVLSFAKKNDFKHHVPYVFE